MDNIKTFVLPIKNEVGVITGGIELIHIGEFARLTHRSVQSTRHLIEDGNKIRKLKFYRDRSRLLIPTIELLGYPLVNAGHCEGERNIYHYNERGEKILCPECSYGDKCRNRKAADALIVPEGDK